MKSLRSFIGFDKGVSWTVLVMQTADREGSDALLVGAQGLGDGAHSSAVVSIGHQAQALLCLRKLSQAVQPEVEVLRRHTCAQTLVQLTGEFMAALHSWQQSITHACLHPTYTQPLFVAKLAELLICDLLNRGPASN